MVGEKSHLEMDATVGRFAEHHTTKSARRPVQHLERVQIVEHVIISDVLPTKNARLAMCPTQRAKGPYNKFCTVGSAKQEVALPGLQPAASVA